MQLPGDAPSHVFPNYPSRIVNTQFCDSSIPTDVYNLY